MTIIEKRQSLQHGGGAARLEDAPIQDRDFNIPERPAPEQAIPEAKPYLATSLDVHGNPFYGSGFKGWVRETFADLFDPEKWNRQIKDLQAGSQLEARLASKLTARNQQYVEAVEESVDRYTHWDDWAQNWFGISAKDIGTAVADVVSGGEAARAKASIEGNNPTIESGKQFIAASTRLFKDASQDAILGGLQVLTGDDYIFRKAHAGNVAIQDLARSVGIDFSTGNAIADNLFLAPIENLVNTATVGISLVTGKLDWQTVTEKVSANLAGSEMAYTMMFDETKREQFNREVAQGKDPALVARNLETIGWEVAGSLFGSPSTYLGLGIPGKFGKAETLVKIPLTNITLLKVPWERVAEIPTLTKILGIEKAFGLGRLAAQAEAFLGPDKEAVPLARDMLRQVGALESESSKVSKLSNITVANAAEYVKNTANLARKWREDYGVFSYMSSGKVAIIIRDAQLALGHLLEISNGNVDQALSMINDLAVVARGGGDTEFAQSLFKLAKSPLGGSVLNKNFQLLGEVIGRAGDDFVKLAKKYGKDPLKFREEIVLLSQKVAEDLVPSVNDMAKAAEKVSKGGASQKEIALAEKYDLLVKEKPMIAWGQTLANKLDKVNTPAVNMQSTMFMGLSPRYFTRNILGQAFSIAFNLSPKDALEISAASFGGLSNAKTEAHLVALFGKIKELGGYVPEAAARGMGQAGKGGLGFLEKAQNAEKIASAEIVYRSMLKEIRNGVQIAIAAPDPKTGVSAWEAVKAVLPREQTNYLGKLLKEYNGDWDKAFKEFSTSVGKGVIPAHRMTEIPETLSKFLSDTGNLTRVEEIQRTAKTQAEFESGIRGVLKELQDKADLSKLDAKQFDLQTVNHPVLGRYVDDLADASKVKSVDPVTSEIFTARLEAARQLQDELGKTGIRLNSAISAQMGAVGIDASDFAEELATTEAKYNGIYREVDGIREQIRPFLKEPKGSQEMASFWNMEIAYKNAAGSNVTFKLADIYQDVKVEALKWAEFRDYVWRAYFDISGSHFAETQLNRFGEMFEILEAGAQRAGGSLDNFAAGVKFPTNPLIRLSELKVQLQDIQKASAQLRRGLIKTVPTFPEGVMLPSIERIYLKKWGWNRGVDGLFNAVNKDRRLAGLPEYESVEKVPIGEALKSAAARINKEVTKTTEAIGKGLGDSRPALDMRPPTTSNMSLAHGLSLSMDGAAADFEKYINAVKNDWGKGVSTSAVDATKEILALKESYLSRIVDVKTKATVYASRLRDFILHDYNKTYLDKAVAYFMPFHYWTDRTYARYFERFLEDPKVIHAYLIYRDAMNKENSDLPEWWRYNLQLTGLPGLQFDHPLYFNLEASMNPLNGLTGTDFNDPYKRVDWLSSTVDDLSKFGFNFTTPIQWAVAANLYRKNEQDAAARWFGRLIPQTTQVKAATSLALGKPYELDPFVNFFSGGQDSYEQQRTNRLLASLVGTEMLINGQPTVITEEMAIDAAHARKGAIYDEAYRLSTNERAPWDLISFFAGLSFKGRTQGDMKVDEFYNRYHQLIAAKNMMSPDAYKASFDNLREAYPFMDTLLIGKRAGPERDTALAYNVLGRIPPGSMSDVASIYGIDNELLQRFYDQKGSFEGWSDLQKTKFMAGVIGMASALALPDNPTKQEWNLARRAYSDMNSRLESDYGPTILDKISAYYDLREAQQSSYLLRNPEVKAALNDITAYKANTPILNAYYGGLDNLERYYSSRMYIELEKTYGSDIRDVANQYYDMKINDRKAAKQLYNERNLRGYFRDLARLKAQMNTNIDNAVQQLPQGKGFGIRPDFVPSKSEAEALQSVQPKTWEDFRQILSPAMQDEVYSYWTGNREMPSYVQKELDFIANQNGYYSGQELLREIGMTIR